MWSTERIAESAGVAVVLLVISVPLLIGFFTMVGAWVAEQAGLAPGLGAKKGGERG